MLSLFGVLICLCSRCLVLAAAGEYTREVAEGVAPSSVKIESVNQIPRGPIPGVLDGMAADVMVGDLSRTAARGNGRCAGGSASPVGLSMTELLLGDDVVPGWAPPPSSPARGEWAVEGACSLKGFPQYHHS